MKHSRFLVVSSLLLGAAFAASCARAGAEMRSADGTDEHTSTPADAESNTVAANASSDDAVVIGEGAHRYRWVKNWGARPDGKDLGNTHGCVAHDSEGRIYVNTDTQDAVMIYDASGKLLKTWGKDFAGGMHGMQIVKEGEREFLYAVHTSRHEVLKCTLDGDVQWTVGWPETSGVYEKKEQYNPTSIAVLPDGAFFVADGYGLSWIHKYDKDHKYVKSFAGPGTEPGKCRTPHGLLLDTRVTPPVLMVADRENGRLQTFDLDGKFLSVISGMLRRPCHMHLRGKELVVADLAGRVTILNEKNELVCHLGDQPDESLRAQNGVPKEKWKDGVFLSPHCAEWDAKGDLYVLDWNASGRVSKLEHVK